MLGVVGGTAATRLDVVPGHMRVVVPVIDAVQGQRGTDAVEAVPTDERAALLRAVAVAQVSGRGGGGSE